MLITFSPPVTELNLSCKVLYIGNKPHTRHDTKTVFPKVDINVNIQSLHMHVCYRQW